MTQIQWRKTAGGVEIAEYDDMTCAVWRSGSAFVSVDGNIVASYVGSVAESKAWFEREHCKPKYTVTKYGDGGEVYASNDGKRVALVKPSIHNVWRVEMPYGWQSSTVREGAVKEAIAYVTGKDS